MKKFKLTMLEDLKCSVIIEAETKEQALTLFEQGEYEDIDVIDTTNPRVVEITEYAEDYNDPNRWQDTTNGIG